MSRPDSPFRNLPAVNVLLDRPELAPAIAEKGRSAALDAIRTALDHARESLRADATATVDVHSLVARILALLDGRRPALRPAINATGVLLNTGLGRAPLAEEAVAAIGNVARGYCNLEFDLVRGERGHRTTGIAERLRSLVGSEAATVVNNNAAATVLALRALAKDKEVVVSRGQLVEIGGSFRLPEIFEVSGARLREVGTTNKTRLSDYEKGIGPDTAALMRVHPSNYRMYGFVESVGIAEVAALAKPRGLWTIDDVGSGALAPDLTPECRDEPTVREGLAAGADLVLFSGDKLLGGPQCGVMVGSAAAVAKVERDPLMRALRVDKLTLAALEATLILAADPVLGWARIPLWRFLTTPAETLLARAERLAERLRASGVEATAVATTARIGGGSHPTGELPSHAVAIPRPSGGASDLAHRLRTGEPAVVPRIQEGSVILDLRGVAEREDEAIFAALAEPGVGRSRS